jgi:hypothetical protein
MPIIDQSETSTTIRTDLAAYVDDPLLASVLAVIDRIACVHMFGLLSRSHMNAGQDGFRDSCSKQFCDLQLPLRLQRPLRQAECHESRIDRSYHLLFLASSRIRSAR